MTTPQTRATIGYSVWRDGYFWERIGFAASGFAAAEEACDDAYKAWGEEGTMLYDYTDAARARMAETGEDREP